MTKDDFELWQAHPITETVFKAMERLEERNKRKWLESSWNTGVANQVELIELRTLASAYRDLRELTYEELEETINGED